MMIAAHKRLLRLAALCTLLAMAACSNGPTRPATGAAPAAPATVADVDAVQSLLMRGNRKGAEALLKPLLKRDPMNSRLILLRDSMVRDPKELLGPVSYAYTVRAGEGFEEIADRLLGNRLKAFQLARYNGIDNPSTLMPGQAIRIPGVLAQPKPAPAPERTSKPAAVAPARPKPATPAPAAKPVANTGAAQKARAAGLAALNRGAVGEALVQLRRAKALDPANPVIARDLLRAERIAATVKARK
jgi:hypothetical protein